MKHVDALNRSLDAATGMHEMGTRFREHLRIAELAAAAGEYAEASAHAQIATAMATYSAAWWARQQATIAAEIGDRS